tara:strand:- start:21 stop:980 length:960 start_codon:yes stop_codon:yes gene_type:complete
MRKKKAVLIVGCGNIGLRHLQSICFADYPPESISIFDPMVINKSRLEEIFVQHTGLKLPESLNIHVCNTQFGVANPNIIIFSSTSDIRDKFLVEYLDRYQNSIFLLEKPIYSLADKYNSTDLVYSNVYVNYSRRMWPFYQKLRDRGLHGKQKFSLTVSGRQWGAGTNAFHFIDLFSYLTGIVGPQINGYANKIFPSKRTGFMDFTGSFLSKIDGHTLTLENESSQNNDSKYEIDIKLGETTYKIDENNQKIIKISDGSIETLPIEIPFQSALTSKFLADIETNSVELTPFNDALKNEISLFEFLNKNFEDKLENGVRLS